MTFKLEPADEIRSFDGRKFEGLEVQIRLGHTNDKKTDQWAAVDCIEGYPHVLLLSGWTGKVLGDKEGSVARVIRSCKLIQHSNGGRSDPRRFDTYWDYFNEERKQRLARQKALGLVGKLLGTRGEDDQADIVVTFDDFEIDSMTWDFRAPQEWSSDRVKDNHRFKFVDGFYEDADRAIDAFCQKACEDLFGTRFFPVLVFPKETPQERIDEIVWRPKVSSDPVLADEWIVFGTRCKPHEYADVIRMTYEAGGKVPIGVEWDW
jgi:hypothetical protein